MADDIGQWLADVGLGRYAEIFADNDIDADLLPHLTEQDLTDLSLSIGHRRKLLLALAARSLDSQTKCNTGILRSCDGYALWTARP
jgi:hypothetical protein